MKKPYSEPDVNVPIGGVVARTEKVKNSYITKLTLQYSSGTELTFEGKEEERKFNPSVIPYKFSLENLGIKINAGGGRSYNIDVAEL